MVTVLPQPMGQAKQKVWRSKIVSAMRCPLMSPALSQLPPPVAQRQVAVFSVPGTPPAVPAWSAHRAVLDDRVGRLDRIAEPFGIVVAGRSFAADGDGFEILTAHHRAHAGASRRARARCRPPSRRRNGPAARRPRRCKPFASWIGLGTDRVEDVVVVVTPETVGVAQFDRAGGPVDPEVDRLLGGR